MDYLKTRAIFGGTKGHQKAALRLSPRIVTTSVSIGELAIVESYKNGLVRRMSDKQKIIYTDTDEAPRLATILCYPLLKCLRRLRASRLR